MSRHRMKALWIDNTYGIQRGMPAIKNQILHRSTRLSILLAYTIHSYLDNILIVQGSVDSESFCNWLSDHILPQNLTQTLDLVLF